MAEFKEARPTLSNLSDSALAAMSIKEQNWELWVFTIFNIQYKGVTLLITANQILSRQ